MRTPAAAASEGRGSRPSPRGFGARLQTPVATAVAIAVVAAVIGLAVGRFLTYTDTESVPLPTVLVPADDEVRRLQQAVADAPGDAAAHLELGIAATDQAIATADPAWYAVAEEALDAAASLDPDDPLTTIAQGKLALSLHDFDRALDLGRTATAALPGTADAWGVLVDAQVELGRYDDAAASVQRMLDIRPDLPALARASYLRQLQGDLDGAIVAMRQADLAGGGGADTGRASGVTALLGDLLLQRGDLDDAQATYERSPTPTAAAGLARIAAARGDTDRALAILTDLVDRTPAPPVVAALAEVQQRAGDEEGLARTVELARTLAVLQQGAGQTVDLELALFEATFGDPQLAVPLAEEAHAARPDNIYATGALAWALHRAGQAEPARELATQATRLDTVDAAHELRMAAILGEGRDAVLARNPLAEDLFIP